ncbi:MAG: hypothetical protein ACLQDL_06165 [Spirochaetia bacterium]
MGSRRFLRRTAIAASLLLVAGLPAQSQSAVHCDALVGFNGTVREGRFAPVVLSIENPGPRMQVECSLRVTWGSGPGGLLAGRTIIKDAVLDAGATRRVPFLVPIPRSMRALRATVTSAGVREGSLDIEPRPLAATSRLIAGISSELSLDGLTALAGGSGVRVVYPRVDDLPVSWPGYDAVDAVIVHDTAFQQLRPDQVDALERWVVTGGVLVFTGGAAALQHEAAGFGRLLPVDITGFTRSGRLAGVPLPGGWALGPIGNVALAESRLRQGRVVAAAGSLPIIVSRTLGRGSIWFLAFDPTTPPMSSWEGALPLWRHILGGDRVPALGAAPRAPLDDPWIAALLSASPESFPGVPALIAFVACYLALLAPLAAARGERGPRPRVRFLLLAAVSVCATLAGWAVFDRLLFQPGLQVLDAARVVTRSGGGLALVTEKVAVFAAAPRHVEVRIASSGAAIEGSGIRTGAEELIAEKENRTTIRGVDVGRLEARLLVIQDVIPLAVSFRAAIHGASLDIVAANGGALPLRGCFILASGRAYSLGVVEPGATVRRAFDLAEGVDPLGSLLTEGDPRRAAFWKADTLRDDPDSSSAQLVGWLDGPVLPLAIPGGERFGGRPGLALLRVESE